MFLQEVGFFFHILLPFSIFCFWVKIISCWEKDQVPARGGSCLSERFHKYNSLPEHRTERLKPRWVSGEWDPRSAAQVCITLALYLNLDLTSEPPKWTRGDSYWTTLKKIFFFFFWNIILMYLKQNLIVVRVYFLSVIPTGQFLTSLSTICNFLRGHACLNPSSVLNCLVFSLFYIQILCYCYQKVTVFWVGD